MNDTDNCGRTGEHLRFHWKYQSVNVGEYPKVCVNLQTDVR